MAPIAARTPVATVRLTPVIPEQPLHSAAAVGALGDLAVENGKVLPQSVEFAQMPVDRLPFVVGRNLALEPLPPRPIEELGVRTHRNEMSMQDGMNFVLDPRAMANDLIAAGRQPALALSLRIRRPDLRQISGREQARQRPRIDLVGLSVGVGDRLHLQRVGDHDPGRERRENPRRRHRVAARCDDRLVGRMQLPAEPFEGGPGPVDPAEAAKPALFPYRRLAKGPVDVDANHPPRQRLPAITCGSGGRHDT